MSSSEAFQRLFIGKQTRSNSPTLLHSIDSAAPAVASPESRSHIQLEEVEETDSRTLGVTAETPQFSPYASTQIFARKGGNGGRKGPVLESGVRGKGQQRLFQTDLDALMDLSIHKETQTESSLDSQSHSKSSSPPRQPRASSDIMKQLALMLEMMDRRESEMRRSLQEVAERLNAVEELSLKQRDDVAETQDNLEATQRVLKDIEEKVEMSLSGELDYRGKGSLGERVDAIERKEAAKVSIFEEIGKEMDTIRAVRAEDTARLKSVEAMLKSECAKHEQQLKTHSERLAMAEKQVESMRGKGTQSGELALVAEQLSLARQEREEDKIQMQNRLEVLEQKDSQVEKVKYFVSLVQKDVYAKVKKVESGCASLPTTLKQLDSRLQVIEDLLAKDLEKREESDSAQSFPMTPPLSRHGSTSRLSIGSCQQLVRLEDRVSDIERELTNFSNVKKKLAETDKRMKTLELSLSRTPKSTDPPEFLQSKTPLRSSRDSNQNHPPNDSPKSIRSTFTASKLIETVSSELGKSDRKARTKAPPLATMPTESANDTSFCPDEKRKYCKTERALGDFLPGEAESVVLGALLERTKRSKPGEIRLSYRSISPISAGGKAVGKQQREPSADLQEFLRKKGFMFEEC